MKLKAITSALASAGMLALVSGSAQAGAMASAMVNMDNFKILDQSGAQVLESQLQTLSFTSTMDYSATLGGVGSISDSANSTAGPGVDKPAVCIGSGCTVALTTDNNFGLKPQQPGYPPASSGNITSNYAAVDQREIGTPVVDNVGAPSPISGYTQNHATISNSAYVSIGTGSGTASTSSNNNLQASWQFTVGSGVTGLSFDFDVDAYMQVALDSGEQAPTFATSSYNIEFTLTCLDAVATSCGLFGLPSISISPDLFDPLPLNPLVNGPKTISLNAPLGSPGNLTYNTGGFVHFNSGVIPVITGKSLQLSARINTLADLQRDVPEPGVLALLGLGLVGIGATLRRRAKA